MSSINMYQAVLTLIFVTSVGFAFLQRRSNGAGAGFKRPPGPRGLPLIGNALHIPRQHMATYFRTLLETYGGLVSLNLAGMRVVLIGDMETAKNILDKRSAKFSSRPVLPYVQRYLDPDESYWAMIGQTETWHIARKLTVGVMASVRTGMTEPLHHFETMLTIQHLLNDGNQWYHHINRLVASTALTAAFGAHCPTGSEPELSEVMFALKEVVDEFNPPASVINFFPFLDWIPGPMPWRTRAKEFRKRENAFYSKIIREAVSGKWAGMNTWAAEFAREDKPEGDQSRLMNMFTAAAIETTGSSIATFVLACLVHPDWIPTAQKQIDDVVGSSRLPTFADRPHLPYVEAILREVLRWRPAVRFGLPHQTTADDIVEYNGEQYFIPADTTVFAVTWAVDHDPKEYTDPDRFDPERFLDDVGSLRPDYETSAFGFGRRICPGIPFAERSIWIAIVMLLWTFDIQKSEELDPETGLPFQYNNASDALFHGDLGNSPRDFPAVFLPRSARHADIARQEWEECEKDINVLLPARREY